MGDNAPGGGGTPSSGSGAGNPDVNELINIAVSKRVKKAVEKAMEAIRGDLASVVKDAMSSQQPTKTHEQTAKDSSQPPGNSAQENERLTLKALEERHKALEAKIVAADKARIEAEAKTRDIRARAETEKRIAARLGADNPLLPLLMDSFYDQRKRVVEKDGHLYVSFKSPYGEDDDLKTLDEGVAALFDKGGEYHSFISSSRAQQLPPGMPLNGPNGMAPTRRIPQQANGQQPQYRNPLHEELARTLEHGGNVDAATWIRANSHAPNQPIAPSFGPSEK